MSAWFEILYWFAAGWGFGDIGGRIVKAIIRVRRRRKGVTE